MEGCELFISGSSICKQAIPKVAILEIRWTMMNTVLWRCVGLTKIKDSSLRVVLKENPNPPLRLVEAASSSSVREPAMITFKEAPNVTRRERGGSPAPNITK